MKSHRWFLGLLAVLLSVTAASGEPYTFATFGGPTAQGGSPAGPSSGTRFQGPVGLAADSAGNVFVAEREAHTIRKITPAGVVTTVAGLSGSAGTVDGVGSAARFSAPHGVAVDPAGNLFVVDAKFAVRKIAPDGAVSKLAGSANEFGDIDGVAGAARFSFMLGIAVDGTGNVFVADSGNHSIRRITPAGVVSTLAGGSSGAFGFVDGVGRNARFSTPEGLAVDGRGNVYVADVGNRAVRKITPEGVVTTVAGSPDALAVTDAVGPQASFHEVTAVAVDPTGTLFVTDFGARCVRRIAPDGTVSTIAGSLSVRGDQGADGTGGAARFVDLVGIAADSFGNVYVADLAGGVVRRGRPNPTATPLRMVNISAHGDLLSGGGTTVLGFTLAGTGTKPVLVRGAGPALGAFGIRDAANDPQLAVRGGSGALIGSNDDWGGGAALVTAFAQVGAFPFPPTSKDAALLVQLGAGACTATVTADRGTTLAEVYDLGQAGGARFSNFSSLGRAGVQAPNSVTLGFVATGEGYQRLLVRAVGPGLGTFGVAGALSSAQVRVGGFGYGEATSTGWAPVLAGEFVQAGAFPFAPGSRDAAIVVTVSAGSYSVQVNGVGGDTGLGLVEVYLLP